jgi:hypothetical protein
MIKRRSLTIPLLLALAGAVAAAGCNGAATQSGSSIGSPAPAQGQAPAPSASPGLADVATPLPTPQPAQGTVTGQVTMTGYVMQIYANGDFVLSDGSHTDTIAMTLTTSVVNLRGREVPRQFIQVAGSVTVTGPLSASTITAEIVSVPTTKDGP